MPAPAHEGDELIKIDTIANRNKDAWLLQYLYAHIRDKVLDSPSRQALSRIKGRAILARLDMLKEAERFNAALKYGDFRQVPIKDGQGLDYAKSLRDLSPKNALETLIRHFTDTPRQKREIKDVANSLRRQQARAEQQADRASDFSFVMDKILDDHCRASGVSANQVAPMLRASEIAELRDFAEKLPYVSRIRKEFMDATSQAERALQATEPQPSQNQEPPVHSREAALTQPTPNTERFDRESSSRGR